MKKISPQEIQSILQVVLSTNISWKNGEAIKKLLLELPDVEDKKEETPS